MHSNIVDRSNTRISRFRRKIESRKKQREYRAKENNEFNDMLDLERAIHGTNLILKDILDDDDIYSKQDEGDDEVEPPPEHHAQGRLKKGARGCGCVSTKGFGSRSCSSMSTSINYFGQHKHIFDIGIHYLEQGSKSGE